MTRNSFGKITDEMYAFQLWLNTTERNVVRILFLVLWISDGTVVLFLTNIFQTGSLFKTSNMLLKKILHSCDNFLC
jgi:hypothetical protein